MELNRPLSPHLSIHRKLMTAVLSISHSHCQENLEISLIGKWEFKLDIKDVIKNYLNGKHILSVPNYFCNNDISFLTAFSLNDSVSLEEINNQFFSNSYKTIFDYFSPEISNLPSVNKAEFELLLFLENVWFDLNFKFLTCNPL